MQVLYDSLDQDSLSPEPRNLVDLSRIPFSKYIYLKSRINLDLDYIYIIAASPRRRGLTVASRLWLNIFIQSLRDCDLTTVASRL